MQDLETLSPVRRPLALSLISGLSASLSAHRDAGKIPSLAVDLLPRSLLPRHLCVLPHVLKVLCAGLGWAGVGSAFVSVLALEVLSK